MGQGVASKYMVLTKASLIEYIYEQTRYYIPNLQLKVLLVE